MYKKLDQCKYCSSSFIGLNTSQRANHSRWCDANPKRKQYENILADARSCITNESILKRNAGIKSAHERGCYDHVDYKGFLGKKHTEETKKLIKTKALQSPHRRLVKSTRYYTTKSGEVILLDSSWEEALAVRLDSQDIKWTRPDPLKWIDENNIEHNYFPDFYLVDYDLYLDPKNPMAYANQLKKIKILQQTFKNIIFLKTLQECQTFSL